MNVMIPSFCLKSSKRLLLYIQQSSAYLSNLSHATPSALVFLSSLLPEDFVTCFPLPGMVFFFFFFFFFCLSGLNSNVLFFQKVLPWPPCLSKFLTFLHFSHLFVTFVAFTSFCIFTSFTVIPKFKPPINSSLDYSCLPTFCSPHCNWSEV